MEPCLPLHMEIETESWRDVIGTPAKMFSSTVDLGFQSHVLYHTQWKEWKHIFTGRIYVSRLSIYQWYSTFERYPGVIDEDVHAAVLLLEEGSGGGDAVEVVNVQLLKRGLQPLEGQQLDRILTTTAAQKTISLTLLTQSEYLFYF